MNNEQARAILYNTIAENAYWQVNKQIVKTFGGKFGLHLSLLLSDLISKEKYFYDRGELTEDGFFYNSQKNIEADTTIKPKEQKKCIDILKDNEILKTKVRKVGNGDTVKHFKINHIKVAEWLMILTKKDNKNLGMAVETIPDRSNRRSNNNKSNNSIINNTISVSEKETRKKILKKNTPLMDYWNSLQNVRKHLNANTKVYQQCNKYFNQLKRGTFFGSNNVSMTMLKKNNIPNSILTHKWSDEEIKKTLKNLSLMFQGGYWPQDKSKLPADLPTLIYNMRTEYSFFIASSAKEAHRYANIEVECTCPEQYEEYKTLFLPKNIQQENLIKKNLNESVKFYYNIIKGVGKLYSHTSFSSHIGSEKRPVFFKHHRKWLQNQGELHAAYLKPDSVNFRRFLTHLEKEYGFILLPNDKQLEILKRDSERAHRRGK